MDTRPMSQSPGFWPASGCTPKPSNRAASGATQWRGLICGKLCRGPAARYSTVTLLARLRGRSTSQPRRMAMW